MVYQANVLSIMIASPSDVVEQREDIRAIISDWNFANAYSRSLILMPVGWETHSAPDLGGRAQAIINDRLLKDSDLLIGVFWTRIGTPTGGFESGTAEEIMRHVDAGKPAMIYFSDAPVAPQALDATEYTKVQDFKRKLYDRGLVEGFTSASEFRDKFRRQLSIQINDHPYLKAVLQNSILDQSGGSDLDLTKEAQQLLLAAGDDANGYIMTFRTHDGTHIQANGLMFGERGSVRSSALWESALRELIDLGYVTSRGEKGEIFQVTNSGYMKIDHLKESENE